MDKGTCKIPDKFKDKVEECYSIGFQESRETYGPGTEYFQVRRRTRDTRRRRKKLVVDFSLNSGKREKRVTVSGEDTEFCIPPAVSLPNFPFFQMTTDQRKFSNPFRFVFFFLSEFPLNFH
jgi:hypothetical protein